MSETKDSAATPDGSPSVTVWERPDLVVAAPGGIFAGTAGTAVIAAGNTFTAVADDINTVVMGNSSVAAQDGIVAFTAGEAPDSARPVQETGIKFHAASGNVRIEAMSDAIKLVAGKNVDLSSNGAVLVAALERILLTAGGAGLEIGDAGITIKAPGKVKFAAGKVVFEGPASAGLSMPAKPAPLAGCKLKLQSAAASGAGKVPIAS